jgi:carbon monoxide dehydrogenase subunit G
MALQTNGQVRVDVDRITAFNFVRDPVSLAACIPGCKELVEVSPGIYSAVLTNEVAFITLSFKVRVEVLKIEAPDTIEAKISGETIGLVGRVTANAALGLSEVGPAQTDIRYTANISLAGRLGGLGEPVFRAKSAEVSKQFGANLRKAIEQVAAKAAGS